MNKIKILLLGFAAISASSLCLAVAAAPPPVVAEKVVSFDAAVSQLPSLEFAVRDFEAFSVPICIEREAVSYVVSESSTAGRSASTYAKVSAQGRMCRSNFSASFHGQPLTYYGQRT